MKSKQRRQASAVATALAAVTWLWPLIALPQTAVSTRELHRHPGRPHYLEPQGYHTVIIVDPPRTGINDRFYQSDNIYGPEASAAGRMSHIVVNPPPSPRVYYFLGP